MVDTGGEWMLEGEVQEVGVTMWVDGGWVVCAARAVHHHPLILSFFFPLLQREVGGGRGSPQLEGLQDRDIGPGRTAPLLCSMPTKFHANTTNTRGHRPCAPCRSLYQYHGVQNHDYHSVPETSMVDPLNNRSHLRYLIRTAAVLQCRPLKGPV